MRAAIPYKPEVAIDIRALSKLFDIPQYILRIWQSQGFISRSVVSAAEWEMFNMIRCCIWDNRNVIRAMLRGLTAPERRRLIDACDKTAIERVTYEDFVRFKMGSTGIMGDGRPVTYERYMHYLSWRHPHLCHLLTKDIFIKQRKAALAKIAYARNTGTYDRLTRDMLCRKNNDAVEHKR